MSSLHLQCKHISIQLGGEEWNQTTDLESFHPRALTLSYFPINWVIVIYYITVCLDFY